MRCDKVSLDIPRGMFGLLGPNGAGKSSLMRTLATLQEADSGSAVLDGADGGRSTCCATRTRCAGSWATCRRISACIRKVSAEDLLEHFAVLKGLTARKQRREVVDALLQQVNLWDARKRKLGRFSGGMRQRFGIAQALLGNPRLVIVDEPTAGLDPEERNRFLNLLAEIGENVAVILLHPHRRGRHRPVPDDGDHEQGPGAAGRQAERRDRRARASRCGASRWRRRRCPITNRGTRCCRRGWSPAIR